MNQSNPQTQPTNTQTSPDDEPPSYTLIKDLQPPRFTEDPNKPPCIIAFILPPPFVPSATTSTENQKDMLILWCSQRRPINDPWETMRRSFALDDPQSRVRPLVFVKGRACSGSMTCCLFCGNALKYRNAITWMEEEVGKEEENNMGEIRKKLMMLWKRVKNGVSGTMGAGDFVLETGMSLELEDLSD